MLEKLKEGIVAALRERGLEAGLNYPRSALPERGSFLRVGITGLKAKSGGFGLYLGHRRPEDGGSETYGFQAEMGIAIDAWAGRDAENGPVECERLLEEALQAVAAMESLDIFALSFGECAPEKTGGLFRMRAEIDCRVIITLEPGQEQGEFTDFVLKGVLS